MIQKLIAQAVKLTQEGKSDEGIKILKYSLRAEPKNVELLYYLGFIYRSLNDFENAQKYYLEALTVSPESPEIYCALGVVHQQKGELEIAVQNFEKAIKLNRLMTAAYNSLGYTLKMMNQPELALSAYRVGMDVLREIEQRESQPLNATLDYSVLCNNAATVLAEAGDFDQAEELFEEAVAFIPEGVDYKAPQAGLDKLKKR